MTDCEPTKPHAAPDAAGQRRADIDLENRKRIFETLAAQNITSAIVTFDGYADSGQIEEIIYKCGDDDAPVPPDAVSLQRLTSDGAETAAFEASLCGALESLAYDVLENHSGWENNDGGFGNITFDVSNGSIILDLNERYTEITNSYETY